METAAFLSVKANMCCSPISAPANARPAECHGPHQAVQPVDEVYKLMSVLLQIALEQPKVCIVEQRGHTSQATLSAKGGMGSLSGDQVYSRASGTGRATAT